MRLFKRLLLVLAVLVALIVAAYVFRAPLLRGAARAWIVNDHLSKADIIVVPGGGAETRPYVAAKLWQEGYAPKILLMNPGATAASRMGLTLTEAEVERAMLTNKDVPAADILISPEPVNSTYEEALATRDWARTNSIRRVIIATDVFHTRRARWIFQKELAPLGVKVMADAVPVREYTVSGWWTNDAGIVAFQNEVLKCAYYRIKY
jgi:uncharacterized SAM-binding protein YcdF (DUF218 family)